MNRVVHLLISGLVCIGVACATPRDSSKASNGESAADASKTEKTIMEETFSAEQSFRSTPPQPGPPRPYRFPEIARFTLESGLRVIVASKKNAPVVSVRAIIHSGGDHDPFDKAGLASLTAEMIDEGTAKHDAMQIAEKVADLGATLNTGSDWDGSYVSLDILSRNLEEGLEIFAEILVHAALPLKEYQRVKSERLTSILQQKDEPSAIAANRFAQYVYGGTAYGNPLIGTESSVTGIFKQDLEAFYRRHYVPNNTSLIITGDVDPEQAHQMADKYLSEWKRGPAVPTVTLGSKQAQAARIYLIDRVASVQSEIRIGHVGVTRKTDDYFSLIIMNSLLGGIFTSRLNLNLREKHGYTYGIRSAFAFRRHAGPFYVSTAVRNEVTMESVREILSELTRIRSGDVTEAELSEAKNFLVGVFPATVQSASDLASRLEELEIYELSEDYFDGYRENLMAVTRQDVTRVASRYLDPEKVAIVVVGKASEVRQPLLSLGHDIGVYDLEGKLIP